MLGAIIGDICGSVYEWNNTKDVNNVELFKKGCFPTDDSVMTIAVARALMDTQGLSEKYVKNALVDSMHYFGHMFRHAGYGGHFRAWLRTCDRRPYNSYGNGSAMRVAAAGWLFENMGDVLEAARMSAEVTHNHPEGIKGAQAIAACVFLARTGSTKQQIRKFVEEHFYSLDFTLDQIRPGYDFDVTCQGSCPQAIEAFLESENFEHAIKLAISIGGDSDTIAAMTGAIAEAYYGIPETLINKLYRVLCDTVDSRGIRHNNSALRRECDAFIQLCRGKLLHSAPMGEGNGMLS